MDRSSHGYLDRKAVAATPAVSSSSVSVCAMVLPCGKSYHIGHPCSLKERLLITAFFRWPTQLPVVFLPKNKNSVEGSLLIPGIPVSEGNLLPVQQQLGEVDGTPALVTDRKADDVRPYEVFLLYTAEQQFHHEDSPKVVFKMREVKRDEFTLVDGCLALLNNDFGNEMKGWALVRVMGKNCSTQSIVTRCKYYEQFTTEEALQAAAKSYGGLK